MRFLSVFALTTSLLAAAPALANGGFRSTTVLSDAQEVQDEPVESSGFARAVVTFDAGLTEARVDVRFRGLVGTVTRLHFHCNVAGANGPIALGLIDFVDPDNDNSDVVTLGRGRISGRLTNADFPAEEPDCEGTIDRPINNIASLAQAIEEGGVYWNLHTDAFPAGELRGQVRPF